MKNHTRRDFFRQVGAGALTAAVGDLGFGRVFAQDEVRLTFGAMEPLVCLLQETPIAKLQPLLVSMVKDGKTDLKQLTAAAALANARTFGGDDYIGFHSMFALMPAYAISRELPTERQMLPILKALYRNTNRIHEFGGRGKEVLKPVQAAPIPDGKPGGEAMRDAIRGNNLKAAEATLATLCQASAESAYEHVQTALHDGAEVHRVNMVYRAWGLLDIVGAEHAHTLLRQSLHYFLAQDHGKQRDHWSGARALLPKLMDEYELCCKPPGKRTPDDDWVEKTSVALFAATPAQAAEIAAAALSEGIAPDAVQEAISIAANQMVLRDENKQAHGSTNGVHCCDAVNAWRHIARVSSAKNACAATVLAAYHFAFDRDNPKRNKFQEWLPYPRQEARDAVKTDDPAGLLRELDAAIRDKDQARAAAVTARYGGLDAPSAPVFALFRGYVISENGSLHGEKYYRTVTEEFGTTRARFRWRQLVGMARYAASMYGEPTPGYAEAVQLLGLSQ
jgi:hypothetical protein